MLVSILVFSIGVLGLVGLQARATQISIGAEDTNRAALLANEIATRMWNAGTVELPNADITAWQTRVSTATTGGLPGGVGTITTLPAGAPSPRREAEILITWNPVGNVPGAPAQSRFVTTVLIPAN